MVMVTLSSIGDAGCGMFFSNTFSQILAACCSILSSSESEKIIANSSPPYRVTNSLARLNELVNISAMALMQLSPLGCPSESLYCLSVIVYQLLLSRLICWGIFSGPIQGFQVTFRS
jgi:hypothetical protein